jgi:hypothetical protein
MAVSKQEQHSPYEQVKALIQDIKAKHITKYLTDRRVYKIPEADWYKLCREFDLNEDETFPRCEYDTSRSILTFKEMPTPVHESIVDFLHRCFVRKISSADSVRVTRTGQCIFDEGEYEGSEKVPDLMIQEKKSRARVTRWVLEVGFSETYEELLQDMRLWLKGDSKVVQCVLMNIIEDPQYKYPPTDMTDEEVEEQGLQHKVDVDNLEGGDYGPISCNRHRHQHQWVGNIREIYMEVWRRDANTGEPEQVGTRRVIHPISADSPPIQLDDILPGSILSEISGLSTNGGSGSVTLSLDWDAFRDELKTSILELACWRYAHWRKEWKKARGECRKEDPDYMEEGKVASEESSGDDRKKRRTKRRRLN